MKNLWIAGVLAAACVASLAKIPPPVLDDAAKAKAAEAAAKAAWQAKLDAYHLCKVQDKVAAYYRAHAGTGAGAAKVSTAAAVASHPAAGAATPAVAGATASSPNVAAKPAVAGGTAAVAAGPATPVGCADPGPFAVNAPAEKPLETSGAHSPAGNATSPPSSKATSAEMAPAKK
ncbi:hypothetical protein ACFPOE_12030 [Caenimonas terrae]|uniref:Uncharacterized protein n=1 Tax=Caenimonas terrae TaxID=696074 RepID=A0ABW0NGM2_9BURK